MSINSKELLRRLVQIPSVNPDFAAQGGPAHGEGNLTDFLQNFVENQGWPWLRQEVYPGRDNLVALVSVSPPEENLPVTLWEVHQDTVGTAGMTIDPFAAHEQEGKIFGRGACDIKGGMAAMLSALSRAQTSPQRNLGTILLGLTINEECGFSGAKAMCRLWDPSMQMAEMAEKIRGPLSLETLQKLRPQQAIVAEPTELNVVSTHKGILRWRCHTHGRAVHSSQPDLGNNAVTRMAEVIAAISDYDESVLRQRTVDPLCGRPTCCVTTIQGGSGSNTVPDHAVIDIDRRLLPKEVPADAYQEIISTIASRVSGEENAIEHESPWNESLGLLNDNNQHWAERFAAVVRKCTNAGKIIGVPYGTNAWVFGASGIPTIVFGPGSIEQAHTEDEWLDVEQLETATEVLYQLAVKCVD